MSNHQEIISKIKFIGTISKHDKINTKQLSIQPNGLYTSIDRTFFNTDTRADTLQFIQDNVSRAFELVITLERSLSKEELILYVNLVNDLHLSKVGLSNLKVTYRHDSKFCCDIDSLLELIDAKLSDKIHLIRIKQLSCESDLQESDLQENDLKESELKESELKESELKEREVTEQNDVKKQANITNQIKKHIA
ncbi:MAG: hypothetical protein ACW98X_20435 [Promethearchaeota archaeon]